MLRQPHRMNKEKVGVIAHNAALYPEKLDRALSSQIPLIEVDLSLFNGSLVVAHGFDEYLVLTADQRKLQNPELIFQRIYEAGKHAYLDLKDNTLEFNISKALPHYVLKDPASMASSNNHKDLETLKEKGYAGKILFSIGKPNALANFLETNTDKKFENSEFGVSIRHTLLSKGVSQKLKDMGLIIAAWNPITEEEIKECLGLNVDFITSDSFKILESI